jgi:hypothetical protein
MYLGDDPEPGTPEFGAMAAARRAALLGQPAPGGFIGPMPDPSYYDDSSAPPVDYGPGSISYTAAQRKATIAATPIPRTSGPPLLYLPTRAVADAASGAASAVGRGLLSGLGPVALVGAGVALYFLMRRR